MPAATQRIALRPGIHLTAAHSRKFKTACLSVNILSPLSKETASAGALWPQILRRGTVSLPDMEALSAALDEHYGATLAANVRKKGEAQCLGLFAAFAEDDFVPGKGQLEGLTGLLCDMLLHPVWKPEYVTGERDNLLDKLAAQLANKMTWASLRMNALMCDHEAYGVNVYGDKESAGALTSGDVRKQYQDALAHCPIEIYYCGRANADHVAGLLQKALSELPGGERRPVTTEIVRTAGKTRAFTESLEVTQGKLSMGFRAGVAAGESGEAAMALFNAAFGGTATSRLFTQVREALSLCYYASSQYVRAKGLIEVNSGIEFDKYEQTRDEILAQWAYLKEGKLTPDELTGARGVLSAALRTLADEPARLEDFMLGQAAVGLTDAPDALAAALEDVTPEEIAAAANKITYDTEYFLRD
jgi:predicted Zn-dependent peptidase